MWNKFFGLVKLVINFGKQTKKHTDKIEDLEEKVQELTDGMTRMAYENEAPDGASPEVSEGQTG